MDNLFINTLFTDQTYFFTVVLVVVFSICCHEFMHAAAALWCGDDTAARSGHLTFNPFKQMGLISLIFLLVAGISWGAVPVNPANFRRRWDAVLVSLAGPATNLLLFVVFLGLFVVAKRFEWVPLAGFFFGVGAVLNMVLFLLNMLPIPPLDGFAVIQGFFPGLLKGDAEWVKGAFLALGVLVFLYIEYLFAAAVWILRWIVEWIL